MSRIAQAPASAASQSGVAPPAAWIAVRIRALAVLGGVEGVRGVHRHSQIHTLCTEINVDGGILGTELKELRHDVVEVALNVNVALGDDRPF